MEHGSPAEIDNYSVNKKIPSLYGNRNFITVLHSLPGHASGCPEHNEPSRRFH